MFHKWEYYVFEYDIADYGQEESSTLRVYPGPPYSGDMKSMIHQLLARLRVDLEVPIRFWSLPFSTSEFDLQISGASESTINIIARFVEVWTLDQDRKLLALINSLGSEDMIGVFANTFRLLEGILNKLVDQDLIRSRWDETVSNDEIIGYASEKKLDLASKLRKRVERLPVYPSGILSRLAATLQPSSKISKNEVFSKLVKFRNSVIHDVSGDDSVIDLPWEQPPVFFSSASSSSVNRRNIEADNLNLVGQTFSATPNNGGCLIGPSVSTHCSGNTDSKSGSRVNARQIRKLSY
ncbi:MAG: hypothetical protein M5R36_26900 [Deltaproteobacteria bacterium]|nr:hypothetical protein [Deltaproteobacteria bacterium]